MNIKLSVGDKVIVISKHTRHKGTIGTITRISGFVAEVKCGKDYVIFLKSELSKVYPNNELNKKLYPSYVEKEGYLIPKDDN